MSKEIDFKLEKVFGSLQGCAIIAFLLDKDYRMARFVGILRMKLKIAVILNSGILIWHNKSSIGYLNLKLECNQYVYAILVLMYLEINKTS